jgi:hypothetical protein
MEQSGPHRDPLVSAPDAGAPARGGWLPFHVAILTVVVGLLLVTSAFLIGYGFYAGQRNIALLKSDYLAQVVETGAGGLPGLPEAAANVLRVQRFRIETGYYASRYRRGWEDRERIDAFAPGHIGGPSSAAGSR